MKASHTPLAVNLAGFVETPEFPMSPYLVDRDGVPFVPVADGGVVLGLHVGDSVFSHVGDHAAPGVTLTHPDPSARNALTAFSCIGNEVVVRTGTMAGATGRVLGKRGEAGRVVAVFEDDVIAGIAPGDAVMVRSHGQGSVLPPPLEAGLLVNISPDLLSAIGIEVGDTVRVPVRAVVPSKLVGNGLGRPVQMWDVDISVTAGNAQRWGLGGLCLGDLVAISDLDVRHNMGFRRGWTTVGIVIHGGSALPGHGPGVTPFLCLPSDSIELAAQLTYHRGVSCDQLQSAGG